MESTNETKTSEKAGKQGWEYSYKDGWIPLDENPLDAAVAKMAEAPRDDDCDASLSLLGYRLFLSMEGDILDVWSVRGELPEPSELARTYPYHVVYTPDGTFCKEIYCRDLPSFIELMSKLGTGQLLVETHIHAAKIRDKCRNLSYLGLRDEE